MISLVLIGAGGHCKSTVEIIESLNKEFSISGILDIEIGTKICGYPIIGNDDLIPKLREENLFLITIGSIRNTKIREKIALEIENAGGDFATVISPNAVVSKRALIGKGTIIYNFAHVNADSVIGQNCIINTASNIEHDCCLGDFVHVSTGAMINGCAKIGNRCFIGSGAVVANCVEICDEVVVGAGAVVIKNISEPGTYVGNPARRIK